MKLLILFLSIQYVSALDRQEFRALIKENNEDAQLSSFKFKKSSKSYFLDLDNDGVNENIIFTLGDGHYYLSISRKNRVLYSQKIRVEGEGKIDKFQLEDIGQGFSTLLIYLREGKFTTIDRLKKSRIDLITFNRKKIKQASYIEGPLISYKNVTWNNNEKELNSNIRFVLFPNFKFKSLVIEDAQTSYTLSWDLKNRTWL